MGVIENFTRKFNLELTSKDDNGDFNFSGCRCGSDGLFSPRRGVEDDDQPDFNSKIVHDYFKKHGIEIETWDHEKGYFTVRIKEAK